MLHYIIILLGSYHPAYRIILHKIYTHRERERGGGLTRLVP
jgi:hypothetical protein